MSLLSVLIPLLVVLFVVVALLVLAMLKKVGDESRLAVSRLGQYYGLVGPGWAVIIPFIDRAIPVRVGHSGILLADGTANFDGLFIPVRVETFSVLAGTRVQIAKFEGADLETRAVVQRAG